MISRLALSSLLALSLAAVPVLAKSGVASHLGGKSRTVKVEEKAPFDADAEAAIVEAVNAERAKVGAAPLAVDPRLQEAARVHSKDMGDLGFFDHTSPVKGREKFTDRIREQGLDKFGAAGENIAEGPFATVERSAGFMKLWMESEGHRENILDPNYRFIGVGVYVTASGDVYATQEFTKLGSTSARPAAPIEIGARVGGEEIDPGALGDEPEVRHAPEVTPTPAPARPRRVTPPAPPARPRRATPPQHDGDSEGEYDGQYDGQGSSYDGAAPSAKLQGLLDQLSTSDDDEAGVTTIVVPSTGSSYYAPAPRSYSAPRYSRPRYHRCH